MGRSFCVAFVGLAALGCPGSRKPAPLSIAAAPAASESPRAALARGAWFQPNGSLVAVDASGHESPELSAPIAPCVTALNKNGYYPALREEQERMADEASLTFPYFLDACARN